MGRSRCAFILSACVLLGCATAGGARQTGKAMRPASQASDAATLAQIYFWRAKPGKSEEYTRYIREQAERIDEAARQAGAFLSVTTYLAADTTVPWTHMRVFALRDSAQLQALGGALTAAGVRLQPDSAKRQQQSEYSATLRDRVGAVVVQLVR